jgi:hypothetical protein
MSTKTRVVVEGGGDDLYQISEYNGTFYVYTAGEGFFSTGKTSIGETDSFDKAISLIKAHSGRTIKRMSDW